MSLLADSGYPFLNVHVVDVHLLVLVIGWGHE